MKKPKEPILKAFAWVLFSILALFILYPLGSVFYTSLQTDQGEWTLQAFTNLFSQPNLRKPILNTLLLGSVSASISTIIGFVFAYAISRTNVAGKKLWKLTATFPMISPPFIVALSAITLLGNNGYIVQKFLGGTPLFSIYSFWGLLLAQVISFFPTAYLVCTGVLVSIDPVLEEAALNAGASRTKSFWSILVPLSLPGLLSSFLLVFIESISDFANPLVLSGDFKVLSVEAYLKIVGSELDLAGGSALALILLIPSLIAFFVQQLWLSNKSFVTVTGKPSSASLRRLTPTAKVFWFLVCFSLASIVYLFYGTAVFGSLVKVWGVDSTFTFSHYNEAFSGQWRTIQDSLLLAAIATPLSGFLGLCVAYYVVRTKLWIRHLIEWSSMLTFAVPGTVVGIGYVLAFNQKPLELQGTWMAIVLLFLFRNAPVGIRASIVALKQIDPSIDEAALNLGGNRGTTLLKILVPLLMPAFLAGFSFSFIRCMNSISAVIFVVSSQWNLMTISIMNFFENGQLSKASALCVILVATVLVVLMILKLLFPVRERKFSN